MRNREAGSVWPLGPPEGGAAASADCPTVSLDNDRALMLNPTIQAKIPFLRGNKVEGYSKVRSTVAAELRAAGVAEEQVEEEAGKEATRLVSSLTATRRRAARAVLRSRSMVAGGAGSSALLLGARRPCRGELAGVLVGPKGSVLAKRSSPGTALAAARDELLAAHAAAGRSVPPHNLVELHAEDVASLIVAQAVPCFLPGRSAPCSQELVTCWLADALPPRGWPVLDALRRKCQHLTLPSSLPVPGESEWGRDGPSPDTRAAADPAALAALPGDLRPLTDLWLHDDRDRAPFSRKRTLSSVAGAHIAGADYEGGWAGEALLGLPAARAAVPGRCGVAVLSGGRVSFFIEVLPGPGLVPYRGRAKRQRLAPTPPADSPQ